MTSATPLAALPIDVDVEVHVDIELDPTDVLPAWASCALRLQPPAGPEATLDRLADLERRLRVQPHPGAATATGPVADHEPDWAAASEACTQLLAQSRDLRAAVGWTRCALSLQGLPGLAAGLAGLGVLLDASWADLHPRLDAAEDPHADERRHLLLGLSPDAAASQPTPDAESLARALRAAQVGTTATREPVAVRDLDHASPAWSDDAAAVARSVDGALRALQRIDAAFHRETGRGLRLHGLQRLLERVARVLRQAADSAAGAASPGHAAADASPPSGSPFDGAFLSSPTSPSQAPVSRSEAAQRLLALARWVRGHEPSSPAPLLIERAAALLQMDFAEIVRTLLPAARSQVEAIAGVPLDPDAR